MNNLYTHTYHDGMTTERHTSRKAFRSHTEHEPRPQIHGPHKPLSEAMKMLAYARQLRRESMTYTKYKLTDSQLRRLSALVHHRTPKYGVAMGALIRKGLVYINSHGDHQVNGNGCIALEQARREGW